MNATCGAQKEGSWVVCSKPPHVTDRHSWETATEYTARMMPRSDDPLDEYRDAGCGHCAHAAHPGRICNNWAGGLDSCACYQPPQWLRDEYAPDTPPEDEDSALAGLPHSGCVICGDEPLAEQPPQPPLSKPNPARAWFWRAVLLGLIIGAIVAGCLGAWGPVDALGAETDQCVTKHEAAATRPGETFRHVVRRAAPDAEQWTDIRFLSPTVRDIGGCGTNALRVRWLKGDSTKRVVHAWWIQCPAQQPGGPCHRMRLFLAAPTTPAEPCLAIAHRAGAAATVDENTVEAVTRSASFGAWSEVDVRVLADGKLVLYHYNDWRTGTTGTGRVEDTVWAEAATFRTEPNGQQITTFAAAAKVARQLGVRLVAELKHRWAWTRAAYDKSAAIAAKGHVYLGGTTGVLHDLAGYGVPLFDRLQDGDDPLDTTAELVLDGSFRAADAAALMERGQIAGLRQTDDPDKWARAVRAGAGYVTTSDPEAFREFCEGLS